MLNRVADIADDDSSNGARTKYAAYDYLGAGTIVTVHANLGTGWPAVWRVMAWTR